MNSEQKIRKQALRKGLIAFFLTFSILLILFTLQFLIKNKGDIFEKNLYSSQIVHITFLGLLTFIAFSFPSAIIVATTIYFREIGKQDMKARIRKSLILPLIISFLSFFWIAFIVPIVNLHEMSLLLDIRSKSPEEPLKRSNLNWFEGTDLTSNYFQLNEIISSMNNSKNDRNENVFYQTNPNVGKALKFQMEKANMIGFPILVFIMYFLGLVLGIFSKKIKLVFIILGFYFFIIPGIYLLFTYLKLQVKSSILTPFQWQFIFLMILSIITILIFILTNRKVKNYCL